MESRTSFRAQWTGKSPLRIVGNLFLGWLFTFIFVLGMAFPRFPQTGRQLLAFTFLSPLICLVAMAGISLARRPGLSSRLWAGALVVASLLALMTLIVLCFSS